MTGLKKVLIGFGFSLGIMMPIQWILWSIVGAMWLSLIMALIMGYTKKAYIG